MGVFVGVWFSKKYISYVYIKCGDGAEGVLTSGWESRGRKEVFDKEEIGQELELLHCLEGEQKCCFGNRHHQDVNGGYNIHNLCQ